MGAQLQEEYVTVAGYLEREDLSSVKNEYFNGRIYAMAGGTPDRATIIFNVSVAFGKRLEGRACSGSSSDQRVKVEKTGLRTYSDVLISCPPRRFDEQDPNALLNPILIAEVLSPSTQHYDRTTKFDHYRQIPELRDYLLVSSEFVRVEHYHREDNSSWTLWEGIEREETLSVPSLELEIPLKEIYDHVEVAEGLTRAEDKTN